MNRTNVVFVLLAAAIVLLLLVQYLGRAREQSRLVLCQERLRGMSQAIQEYEANVGHLPPGTLGQADGVPLRDWNRLDSPLSWQRVPNTSLFVFVQTYLEGPASQPFPESAVAWTTPENWSRSVFENQVRDQGCGRERMAELRCPADAGPMDGTGVQAVVASQPVAPEDGADSRFQDDFGLQFGMSLESLGRGNYLGNGGVTGGRCELPDSPFRRLKGPMRSRSKTVAADIPDGASTTLLIGETIGRYEEGKLTESSVWAFGGVGIIRGDFPSSDLLKFDARGQRVYLGGAKQSSARGFGSLHGAGVNFLMAGGEFSVQSRNIAPQVLFSLAASDDGAD